MSYPQALAHLDALGVDAMKTLSPSLDRIEALTAALDHPERVLPAIHITGTNGKTSTAHIATGVLSATGLRVATYTSPHLQDITERLTLDSVPISEEAFGELFGHIKPYIDLVEGERGETLSYFEVLTAMFFLWAADVADVMVVEVGLGGRWDATNVMTNVPVAVITNVRLDHTGMLGMDETTIAKEKSGIIKPGATVVTAELRPDVLEIIDGEASGAGANVAKIERDFRILDNRMAVGGRLVTVRTSSRDYADLFLPLYGAHQATNSAVALEAVTSFLPDDTLGEEVVAAGLSAVHVPGRLEMLKGEDPGAPRVVLDVAHNPDGMAALASSLHEAFAFEQAVVVIGILADKDIRGMLSELTRIPCTLIATRAESVRSAVPEALDEVAAEVGLGCEVVPSLPAALRRAVGSAGSDGLVVVTGSHYVVGEARRYVTA